MQNRRKLFPAAATLVIMLLAIGVHAQDAVKQKMTIQATARGTSTQMGRQASVNIIIEQFSTDEERAKLIEAFKKGGNDELVSALQDLKPKGRLAITGTVGNDVKFIRELPPTKEGRRFRLVTDRSIGFLEARNQPRSEEYSVSAVELLITPDPKNSTGTLLPACKLKVNKKTKDVEIEAYQNPWQLMNFLVYDK